MNTPAVLRTALRRPRPCPRPCSHIFRLSAVHQLRRQQSLRQIHTTRSLHAPGHPTTITNMLASDVPPPVQVSSVGLTGIKLADGLVLTGPVVFLDGKVLLWDVPGVIKRNGGTSSWDEWTREHWEVFQVVVPKPGKPFAASAYLSAWLFDRALVEILIFGTGARMELVPSRIRGYMKELGIQMDIMDTVGGSFLVVCCASCSRLCSLFSMSVLEERVFDL